MVTKELIFFNIKEANLKHVSLDLLREKSHPQQGNGNAAGWTLKSLVLGNSAWAL